MDDTEVRVTLARTPGLTAQQLRRLLEAADGDARHALRADVVWNADLLPAARSYLTFPDESLCRTDLQWLAASGACLILSTDPQFPPALLQHGPAALYVLGRPELLCAPQIAMVGSRLPTPAGRDTARQFAASFAASGVTVTSGLATGIDGASHESALLAGGTTIAICASGLDRTYPREHRNLAGRIRDNGALVSEFPPGTAPLKRNFPQRNRIISALSLGTLIVEASNNSGSLVTARLARQQGRPVYAVPGSIHNPRARGCHKLIKEGATLVESPADVLSDLKIPFSKEALARRSAQRVPRPALDKGFEMLLDALGFEPAGIDVLAARTGLSAAAIASMLLILELDGRITPYPGGQFGRIP